MIQKSGNKIFCKEYKNQLLLTLSVNLITFAHGVGTGWISPVLPLLQSDKSPLGSGPISLDEASWIGALVCIGGLIGNSSFGLALIWLSRKTTLYLLAIPHACFWLTIILSSQTYHLYIARILGGTTGGGIYIAIPIFISEISDNNIRGTLGSFFMLAFNCGILCGYILSSHLEYYLLPQIMIGFPLIYLLAISLFPQTPQYLIQNDEMEHAEKSFRFYRNFKGDAKEEIDNYNELFKALKKNIIGNEEKSSRKVTIKDFLKPDARKGILVGFTLLLLTLFSGHFAIVNYSSTIFNKTGSSIDSNLSTIIIGCIQIMGTYISTILCDKTGRKILLAVSSFGTSIGLITMGLHSYFWKDYDLDWLPVTSLCFAIFVVCLGIIPLPFVVITEVIPRKIKAIVSTVLICTLSILGFAFLKLFPILMEVFQLHGVMWFCGSCCLAGGFFVIFFVPETKGKSLDVYDEDKP